MAAPPTPTVPSVRADRVGWRLRRAAATRPSGTVSAVLGSYELRPIGTVRSGLRDAGDAPPQGDEGGPEAWLDLDARVADGLDGVAVGDALVVLTWLHLADRDTLRVHPRGDEAKPLTGVFATRSPHRPNPVGLHPVVVLAREAHRLRVAPLEAVDGTPILDLKPVLTSDLWDRDGGEGGHAAR